VTDTQVLSTAAGSPAAASAAPNPLLQSPMLGLVVPVALAGLWETLFQFGFTTGRTLPAPSQIAQALLTLSENGDLARHVSVSLMRVLVGFLAGAIVGSCVGAIAGYVVLVRRLIDPALQGLRAVPSIAWVPLFILWFGIFETSKIMLIATGVFFPVYLGVLEGITAVDRKVVEVGRIFRLSPLALARRVLLPSILPSYVVALRTGLGLGWMFVVAAEFMGAAEGIGYLLIDGQQLGKPEQIVAAIAVFAVLGKATDWALVLMTAPFLRWQDRFAERL
jgi:sulfonate transport system permease protein